MGQSWEISSSEGQIGGEKGVVYENQVHEQKGDVRRHVRMRKRRTNSIRRIW
jgi:hypothetical protein